LSLETPTENLSQKPEHVARDPEESGIGESEILRARETGLRKSRNPESKSKPSGWRGTRVTRSSVSEIRGTRHRGHSSLETTIRSGPSIGGTGVRDQAPSAFDTSGNRNFRGQETRDRISREIPRKGSQPLILVGRVAGDLGESAFGASGFPKARNSCIQESRSAISRRDHNR
jgi:hypothetical protein